MQAQETRPTLQSTPVKTPYRAPKLVRYGQLASLTQSGGTAFSIEDATFTFVSNL